MKLDRGERKIFTPVRRIIVTANISKPTKKQRFVVMRPIRGKELVWNRYFDEADADDEVQKLRASGHEARIQVESDTASPN